jgi:hypothetical protein
MRAADIARQDAQPRAGLPPPRKPGFDFVHEEHKARADERLRQLRKRDNGGESSRRAAENGVGQKINLRRPAPKDVSIQASLHRVMAEQQKDEERKRDVARAKPPPDRGRVLFPRPFLGFGDGDLVLVLGLRNRRSPPPTSHHLLPDSQMSLHHCRPATRTLLVHHQKSTPFRAKGGPEEQPPPAPLRILRFGRLLDSDSDEEEEEEEGHGKGKKRRRKEDM